MPLLEAVLSRVRREQAPIHPVQLMPTAHGSGEPLMVYRIGDFPMQGYGVRTTDISKKMRPGRIEEESEARSNEQLPSHTQSLRLAVL